MLPHKATTNDHHSARFDSMLATYQQTNCRLVVLYDTAKLFAYIALTRGQTIVVRVSNEKKKQKCCLCWQRNQFAKWILSALKLRYVSLQQQWPCCGQRWGRPTMCPYFIPFHAASLASIHERFEKKVRHPPPPSAHGVVLLVRFGNKKEDGSMMFTIFFTPAHFGRWKSFSHSELEFILFE